MLTIDYKIYFEGEDLVTVIKQMKDKNGKVVTEMTDQLSFDEAKAIAEAYNRRLSKVA